MLDIISNLLDIKIISAAEVLITSLSLIPLKMKFTSDMFVWIRWRGG